MLSESKIPKTLKEQLTAAPPASCRSLRPSEDDLGEPVIQRWSAIPSSSDDSRPSHGSFHVGARSDRATRLLLTLLVEARGVRLRDRLVYKNQSNP